MPRPSKGSWPRSYTEAERIALVTEIEQRFRSGEGSLRAIATSLGTCEASYYNWTKAGIKPQTTSIFARRFGPEERDRLLAEIDGHLLSGLSESAACKAVGISLKSLRRWRDEPRTPQFRPVEVTALVPIATPEKEAPRPSLCLVAPGGYRVDGLTLEDAAALLRALA